MNNWNFIGNLGKDAETKALPNGTTVCQFSVATTSGFGDKQKTTWARCAIFGKRAEGGLPQYLVKGQKVAISGEISLDEWEKDGQKHSALKVNVGTIDLVGAKEPSSSSPHPAPPPQNQPSGGHDTGSGFDSFDDDIPFS